MNMEDVRIGQRVKYIGGYAIGECVGVVQKLYPPDELDHEEFPGAVKMKPDTLPNKWPYTEDVFAPWVSELQADE